MAASEYEYETLAVSQPREWVTEVKLNRPEKRNAMNKAFWRWTQLSTHMARWSVLSLSLSLCYREMVDCFQRLSEDSSCRVVLLTAEGKTFSAGHTTYHNTALNLSPDHTSY